MTGFLLRGPPSPSECRPLSTQPHAMVRQTRDLCLHRAVVGTGSLVLVTVPRGAWECESSGGLGTWLVCTGKSPGWGRVKVEQAVWGPLREQPPSKAETPLPNRALSCSSSGSTTSWTQGTPCTHQNGDSPVCSLPPACFPWSLTLLTATLTASAPLPTTVPDLSPLPDPV